MNPTREESRRYSESIWKTSTPMPNHNSQTQTPTPTVQELAASADIETLWSVAFQQPVRYGKDDQVMCARRELRERFDRLSSRCAKLKEALAAVIVEANQHTEYNPIGKVERLPKGYKAVIEIARLALLADTPEGEK